MFKTCLQTVVMIMVLATAGTAFAEGFALYEFSARGLARGGTVASPKADPSTVAYNPSLMTRLPGQQAMAGVTFVMPKGKIDTYDASWNKTGSTGMKDFIWPLPHAYYTHQISEKLFFGIGGFSRFGLGFEYDDDWPGRYHSTEISLVSGSLNPNIAWAATDSLSLALGVEVIYGVLDLTNRIDPTGMGAATGTGDYDIENKLKNIDGFGVGATVSAHYQFNEQWSAGLLYRSQMTLHAKGDAEFKKKGLVDPELIGLEDCSVKASITVPDSVTGGVAFSPVPELTLEASATWTRWSTFDSLDFEYSNILGERKNKKDWRNTWRLGVGAEYQATDWLALRAGFVWDESPMTEEYEDYLVPTSGRRIYSLGAGFNLNESWTLDLVYAYIDASGRSYQKNNVTHTENSNAKPGATHTFGFSVGYKF